MEHLLLVDDDPEFTLAYQKELEAEGYRVTVVNEGHSALKQVRDESIRLVILDIRMPDMDGIEVLGKIMSLRPGLPVIIYTAYDSYRDSFLSWAADAYILKSPDFRELKDKIKELLGRQKQEGK